MEIILGMVMWFTGTFAPDGQIYRERTCTQ